MRACCSASCVSGKKWMCANLVYPWKARNFQNVISVTSSATDKKYNEFSCKHFVNISEIAYCHSRLVASTGSIVLSFCVSTAEGTEILFGTFLGFNSCWDWFQRWVGFVFKSCLPLKVMLAKALHSNISNMRFVFKSCSLLKFKKELKVKKSSKKGHFNFLTKSLLSNFSNVRTLGPFKHTNVRETFLKRKNIQERSYVQSCTVRT